MENSKKNVGIINEQGYVTENLNLGFTETQLDLKEEEDTEEKD